MSKYKTLQALSTGEFKDRGSRFIGYAQPADNEDEAKKCIDEIWKEHHKARHVCYAYKIGIGSPVIRTNDDGEPSNTGGQPILNYINKYELDNVVIGVVRYFGGVLLGKGGLINAYGTAAEEAIKNGQIISAREFEIIEIEFDFKYYASNIEILKKYNAEVLEEKYAESCQLKIKIEKDLIKTIEEEISK
jgi:uncharacterized YigZ family protein